MCRSDMATRKEDGTEQTDINNILQWTQVAFTAGPEQLPWPDSCIKKRQKSLLGPFDSSNNSENVRQSKRD